MKRLQIDYRIWIEPPKSVQDRLTSQSSHLQIFPPWIEVLLESFTPEETSSPLPFWADTRPPISHYVIRKNQSREHFTAPRFTTQSLLPLSWSAIGSIPDLRKPDVIRSGKNSQLSLEGKNLRLCGHEFPEPHGASLQPLPHTDQTELGFSVCSVHLIRLTTEAVAGESQASTLQEFNWESLLQVDLVRGR